MNKGFLYFCLVTLLSCLYGAFVVFTPVWNGLLFLMMTPVVLASLHYSRIVYLLLTTVVLGNSLGWLVYAGEYSQQYFQSALTISCCVVFVCEIIRNLSCARYQAEKTLQAKEENFRSIIENSLDVVATINRDGSIRYVNPSVKKMLGFDPTELQGVYVSSLIHPDDRIRLDDMYRDALQKPMDSMLLEMRIRHANGSYLWIEIFCVNHLNNPNIAGFVVHSRDISLRRKAKEEKELLEKELFQSKKIEAIGRLAGGIAHDFNNLLTVISGYAKLVLKNLEPDHRMVPKLAEIVKAGERGSSLTRQLLAFSRKQVLTLIPVQLNSIIKELHGMLQRLIHEHIVLEMRLDTDAHRIKADPIQIEQVIVNLCINARDAMPKGGTLILQTENVELTPEMALKHSHVQAGTFVKLSVMDTGVGMDEETMSHVFDPFYTTKEVGKGTGLGLSMVYGIVKQCHGFIEIDSTPDRGSVFQVYFPKTNAEESAMAAIELTESPRGEETILLVEDDKEVRSLIKDLLMEHGYHVLEAFNGEQAIQISYSYDGDIALLFTDIVMPGKNGFDTANHILLLRPLMKVLYFSGHTETQFVRRSLEGLSHAILRKPFTPDVLLLKIRDVLDATQDVIRHPQGGYSSSS